MSSPSPWFSVESFSLVDTKQMLGGLILATLLARLAWFSMQKKHKDIKRVPGLPIIGNLAFFLPPTMIFDKFTDAVLKYGDLLELWIFNHRIIVTADHALAKEVSSKRPNIFRRTRAIVVPSRFLGYSTENGIFFAEGEAWSRQRRLTSPSFNHKNVGLMKPSICEQIDAFILILKSFEVGKVIEMDKQLFSYTVNVISAVAFGELPQTTHDYFFGTFLIDDIHDLFDYLINRMMFPFPGWIWRLSPYFRKETTADKANTRFTSKCAEVIKSAREASKIGQEPNAAIVRKSFIDNLISCKPDGDVGLTDDEILANVKVIFLAGSDTTSVVITWVIYHLCIDASLLKAVQEEVDSVLGPKMTGADAVAAIPHLPLCTAVFKEALRLKGPAESFIYQLVGNESTTLSNGLKIYPGDEVFLHFQSLNCDPKVYPNPEVFDAYRWLASSQTPERLLEMDNGLFSFGHGPRVCPGQALAKIEAVAAIIAMVHTFDMKLGCPVEDVKRVCKFVTKPNQMPVILTERI